ncbi:glycosyltransferase family 4 protein [Paenibacillus sp. HN-1]|uniref:glycosyltransferase family 4 protein n=1 Tax=Paenibacillus TaxID=44249 RepID=UPI001CAA1C44|nr:MULTISPECIES: glycosyltransferase family 4 protein [Paenibacillus]MBY9078651.1 glycosyltransferase family 4 protein [Paenibacillus sp. CGMCC 1.18879]MBY9084187.1 glycosyltransferase family 4 protein [Paenibacillus sinensis]
MADKPAVVLFSHVSNGSSITGAEKLLLTFARELAPYFDCLLAAPKEGKLTRQARQSGIPVELLSIPLLYGLYTPYAGLEQDLAELQGSRDFRELTAWLDVRRPAFIVTSTCVNVLPAAAAKSLGIPVVWKISETIAINEYTAITTGIIHRLSDQILCISETAAEPFGPEAREHIALLPPTWNDGELMEPAWSKLRSERRRELNIKPGHPLVGYISSYINEPKGLEHFIHMAVAVAAERPDCRFLVIGEPGDKAYYARCLKKVKLEGLLSRFRFTGYEACPPQAYCAMDVVVVPSLVREGFGMTALEGLVFGKPVVAYDSGGLGEILRAVGFEDGLAPPQNHEILAHRVLSFLNPALAGDIGYNVRLRATALYGPAAYRERLRILAENWLLRWPVPPAAVLPPAPEPPAAAEGGSSEKRAKGLKARRSGKPRGGKRRRLSRHKAPRLRRKLRKPKSAKTAVRRRSRRRGGRTRSRARKRR